MGKKKVTNKLKQKKVYLGILLALIFVSAILIFAKPRLVESFHLITPQKAVATFGMIFDIATPTPSPSPTPVPTSTPTPTPTPRPLTFAEMNTLYGPCAVVPVLMYHHIQNLNIAKQEGHAGLTVDTELFQKQMQYLKDRGYTPIRAEQLIAFFDSGTAIPGKPVLLTFDDGYDDFGSDAAPILRAFGFPALAFIPTGLIQNPGYMSWQTIADLASQGLVYLANHTWSHHNVSTSLAEDQREIGTADTQLSQHGVNGAKVFAYPYGNPSTNGETVLSTLGYKLAFTTYPGFTQCRGRRFILSRTRIGNAALSAYGL
jgi:peptidoglycan/xylan/chitin deacetylase (PgdA/CDA1 family)